MNTTFNHDYSLEYNSRFQPYMSLPTCEKLKLLEGDLLNHLNAIILAHEDGVNVDDWESFLAPQLFFFPQGVRPYLMDGMAVLDLDKLPENVDLDKHLTYIKKWRDEYAPEFSKETFTRITASHDSRKSS